MVQSHMAAEQKLEFVTHGIQLNYVGVKEVHFQSDRLPGTIDSSKVIGPTFTVGRTAFDEKTQTIQVGVIVELSHPDHPDFAFKIELVSQFRIDKNLFPLEKVQDWADRAAFYVLFPYLREEVYSLSIRVGMKPIVLPLLQIPTFKVEQPGKKAVLETAIS